jgi:hypothetical protein
MRFKRLKTIGFTSLVAILFPLLSHGDAKEFVPGMTPPGESRQVAQVNSQPLSGYWTLEVEVTKRTNQTIFFRRNYQILVYLEQDGRELSGEFIETIGNICDDATLSGTIDGNEVIWTVLYQGTCCGGAITKFEGVRVSSDRIEGTVTPTENRPGGCTLWWANAIANRGRYFYR